MTDYSNWKVLRTVINYTGDDPEQQAAAQAAQDEYTQVLEWCETNPYYVAEVGEYYQTTLITDEDKAKVVRDIRNSYLERFVDPYVGNPLRWADMSQEEQQDVVDYRLYLLNIPEQPEFPDIHVMTFDEWKAGE